MGCDPADPERLTPPAGLVVAGRCRDGADAIVLLSPDGPALWRIFSAAPEFADGAADPLDRWSRRIVLPWAAALGGQALFPSDGPPHPPFVAWALASGRCWSSPVGMLVHDRLGLFVSFRAALRLPGRAPEEVAAATGPCQTAPCQTCTRPCLAACPVDAFRTGYDTGRCHDWLSRPQGVDCMNSGCRVRRACPLSKGCGRLPEQSAWHMRQFHP
ncbi:ferredoxin [Paracoccus spongiarum]|uniref:Ferredoxin n=1 Tax=Paracoccus spongiarum TaxID=3064387 RepID=A0ABT9J806_9RHOB|nr:ferredoxin [Paracoccus sp. 2205BS29-5]MDP5305943.1 ferredoxin [Paracoccus sp. 2205BS29-5]